MTITIVLAGFGDVGENKFTPALLHYVGLAKDRDFPIMKRNEPLRLIIIDVDPDKEKAINKIKEEIRKKQLNMDIQFILVKNVLDYEKLIELINNTNVYLGYIAAPNKTHVRYIDFFLRLAKLILVEKPLCDNLSEISNILSKYHEDEFRRVRLVDHYLFKDVIREFLEHYDKYLEPLGEIKKIDFYLLESGLIRLERSWLYNSGMIRDLSSHYFSILFKLYDLGFELLNPKNFRLISVEKARYHDKYIPTHIQNPKETFAVLKFQINKILSTCTIGKGVGIDKKELIIEGENGSIIVNTIKNAIYMKQNTEIEILYQKEVPRYHEYYLLLDDIFHANTDIGLPFHLAIKEVEFMEKTDAYRITKIYEQGQLPFSINI